MSEPGQVTMRQAVEPFVNTGWLPRNAPTGCRQPPAAGRARRTAQPMAVKNLLKPMLGVLAAGLLASAGAQTGAPMPPAADQRLARQILQELIQTHSDHAHGSTVLAQKMAKRFLAAGFPAADVQLLTPPDHPSKGNLLVRLRGAGVGRPVLFLGHLDVVDARRQDWLTDPFQLVEKDGYFWGRGVLDMKGEDAAMVESLIRLRREGFRPDRDILLALTADEEAGGDANGVDWLLRTHREAIDAEWVFNADAGGGRLQGKKATRYGIQTSEKVYATFRLETANPGGHSSVPRSDNAIYQLSNALQKLAAFRFPLHLTETNRAYYAKSAAFESDQRRADMLAVAQSPPDPAAADRLSADPIDNARLRTTGVVTLVQAGEAENALPQRAVATYQCRLVPGETVEETRQRIVAVIADPEVSVRLAEPVHNGGESRLTPQLLERYERTLHSMWPELVVMPSQDNGGSDFVYTRAAGIPSFGTATIFSGPDNGIHGRNEHGGVANFYEGVELTYRLIKALSAR